MSDKVAVVPAVMRGGDMPLSPGVISGGFLFVTGMTGAGPDGMSPDPEAQFRAAFDKIALVLSEAGVGWDAVVEMVSYHIGIAEHFDMFQSVWGEFAVAPFPAWTAVEVAGLRRPGALVEIRVVARAAPRETET